MSDKDTLMMDVTRPDGTTTSYGRYPADQIKAYCHRVKLEHQLTQVKRVLREPTPLEMEKCGLQDNIFRMESLAGKDD
jgi:hypothetical protein